jgi:hypothetical protein
MKPTRRSSVVGSEQASEQSRYTAGDQPEPAETQDRATYRAEYRATVDATYGATPDSWNAVALELRNAWKAHEESWPSAKRLRVAAAAQRPWCLVRWRRPLPGP